MNNFQIESAQNVNIRHNVASIGHRVVAWIIDIFVIIVFFFGVNIGLDALNLDNRQEWVYVLIIGLPILLYHLLMETFLNGRSIGKMALKIRVVKLDGSSARFSDFLLRWIFRIIDLSFSLGSVAVVTILLNGKGQRLGDLAAKTTVVSLKNRMSYRDTLHVDLPNNYRPKYPQVSVFSDSDIQTIKQIYTKAKIDANHRIISTLAEKTKKIMEVEPNENPEDFLKIVIKDYNYYTQQ